MRENAVHWDVLVYTEMFIAGVAAGVYFIAMVMEVAGRGRSNLARSAHLIAFPLMAIAGVLLIVDLNRPERFWHMIVQSQTSLPMFKPWSPMSLGSWLVLLFPALAFVSFVDAVVDKTSLSIFGWRHGHTLHGSGFGKIWGVVGSIVAFGVASYSGVLLSTTSYPGWGGAPLIGALFVSSAMLSGLGALLLFGSLTTDVAEDERVWMVQASMLLIVWQLLLGAAFLLTSWGVVTVFMHGLPLLAFAGSLVLGAVVPLVWIGLGGKRIRSQSAALIGLLLLVGVFLMRYSVVMGPQFHA